MCVYVLGVSGGLERPTLWFLLLMLIQPPSRKIALSMLVAMPEGDHLMWGKGLHIKKPKAQSTTLELCFFACLFVLWP